MRFHALLALARLGHPGLLTRESPQSAPKACEEASPSSFLDVSIPSDLLRAARILVRSAVRPLTRTDEVDLLLLVRHQDARVRQIAINAASLAISSKTSQTLETIVLAALYDPDQETVERAIVGV